MTRRCSHCGNNGHNSRTCPSRSGGGGVKLFGVRLTDGSIIKKSASMGNLSSAHYHSPSSSAAASPNPGSPSSDPLQDPVHVPDGYLSDDPAHASRSTNRRVDRKKGIPWTEEEHRRFLLGLQKLGKGDWRGISRNFVTSRTPAQVASHAQKYFIRQSHATRRKRRSSLFDMAPDLTMDLPQMPEEPFTIPPQVVETDNVKSLPSLDLSLKQDSDSIEGNSHEMVEDSREAVTSSVEIQSLIPSFYPAYVPAPLAFWPSKASPTQEGKRAETSHQVLKPTPLLPKENVNVDEVVGMSQLTLGETETGHVEPSLLSLSLLGDPSRQSAFHGSSASVNSSEVSKGNNGAVQAI